MVTCSNCGAAVSRDYVRVFSRDGETVQCCPRCPDRTRDRNGIREKRAPHAPSEAEL